MASIRVRVEIKDAMKEIRRRFLVARRAAAKEMGIITKRLFESTTKTIDENIRFRRSVSKGGARVAVGTDNEKYKNITEGFEYTTLLVGRSKRRRGFQPKTRIKVLASFEQVGIAYPDVLKSPLKAPAREFPEKIVEELTSPGGLANAKSITELNYRAALSGRKASI